MNMEIISSTDLQQPPPYMAFSVPSKFVKRFDLGSL